MVELLEISTTYLVIRVFESQNIGWNPENIQILSVLYPGKLGKCKIINYVNGWVPGSPARYKLYSEKVGKKMVVAAVEIRGSRSRVVHPAWIMAPSATPPFSPPHPPYSLLFQPTTLANDLQERRRGGEEEEREAKNSVCKWRGTSAEKGKGERGGKTISLFHASEERI